MVSRRQTKSVVVTSSDSDDLPDHPFPLQPARPVPTYYDGIPLRRTLPVKSAPKPASQNDAPSVVSPASLKRPFGDEIAGSSLNAAIDLTSESPVSYNLFFLCSASNLAVKVADKSNQERCNCQRCCTAGFGKSFFSLNAVYLC